MQSLISTYPWKIYAEYVRENLIETLKSKLLYGTEADPVSVQAQRKTLKMLEQLISVPHVVLLQASHEDVYASDDPYPQRINTGTESLE